MRVDTIFTNLNLLHHFIGKTRIESRFLKEMNELVPQKLEDNNIVVIEKHYFISDIILEFLSLVVFYGLKLTDFLNIDLSASTREIGPGVEVNFLHSKQPVKILDQYAYSHYYIKQL